jgi:predicted dienelactone hydrolase
MVHLREWCAGFAHNDCVFVLKEQVELADLAGLDAVPEGLWPDRGDPRIDAVLSMAPRLDVLGPSGLQEIDLPTMFLIGAMDANGGATYWPIDP